MKLYATTRNATTSKGIGDPDMLVIELKIGNWIVGTLKFTMYGGNPYLEIQLDGTWYEISLDR